MVDPGAPMILSFFLRSPGDRTFPTTRKLAAAIRTARRSEEPVQLGDTVAGTFDHFFTWDEIETELADAGFTVVARVSGPDPHLVARAG